MTAKLNGRLEQLEDIAQQRQTRMANAVMQAALAALCDADLKTFKHFCERLVRGSTLDEALANCTPAETAAIERFNAEGEPAELMIKGRSLSRDEANSADRRPGSFR
jgi:predicted secreted protein